jgi:reverse gyrase
MTDKFKELVEKLDEKEASNLVIILSSLLDAWEDDKINLYSEIQDFEITTIYKVLNLFKDDRQTEDAS